MAQALPVAYRLDGGLRQSGDRLRIAARLMRAQDGFVVWTQTDDRPAGDVLRTQSDIAVQMATALKPVLLGGSEADASRSGR